MIAANKDKFVKRSWMTGMDKASRFPVIVMIGVFFSALLVAGCKSGNGKEDSENTAALTDTGVNSSGAGNGESFSPPPEEKVQSGRWIDNETYQVTVFGTPSGASGSDSDKRSRSKKNGTILAQKKVLEDFKKLRSDHGGKGKSSVQNSQDILREFETLVMSGTVRQTTYYSDQSCELVYEVHATDLKQKVMYPNL